MKARTAVPALKLCDPLVRPGHGKVTYQQAKMNYRPHRQVASESSFCLVFPEINYNRKRVFGESYTACTGKFRPIDCHKGPMV